MLVVRTPFAYIPAAPFVATFLFVIIVIFTVCFNRLVNRTPVRGNDPKAHEITADISDLDFPCAFPG
jgi:hypothetical protein